MDVKTKRAAAKALKQLEARVDAIAQQAVYRIPINIMDIRKVYDVARKQVEAGASDDEAREATRKFAESIRAA